MKHLTPKQLTEFVEKAVSNPFLLDVREPWEYDVCHIDKSNLIPMGKIHLEQESLDKTKTTVVICHHGIRSRQVAMYLESVGFADVINLSGGIDAWAQEVDLTMPTY